MIKKRRPVSCPNIAAGRQYFANYINNTRATAFLDTSLERYCPRYDHFEAIYGQKQVQIMRNLAFP